MPFTTTAVMRATIWLMLALASIYVITLVPGVGPDDWSPAIDGWLNMTVNGLIIVVLLLRASLDRRDRTAWLVMTAGLGAAFTASTAYLSYYQYIQTVRTYSLVDLGYLFFYLLLALGLFLRLRTRAQRLPFSLSLDGLIAGLTAVALAETYIPGAAIPVGLDPIGVPAEAYPVGDLLLLAVAVAALVILGRGAGRSWWLLCASFVVFFLTDATYADMVARGVWVNGGPVDVGWLVARLLLIAAALASLRPTESRTVDLEGLTVLVLPGVCGVAVLALLFDGIPPESSTFASVCALCAGLLMVGRTALTFRELRELTQRRERALSERLVEAQDDERARIAADVHDDSIQTLAAADLRLSALRNRLRAHAPGEVAGVEATMEAVHDAGVRLRHLLFDLETPVLDAPLPAGLREAAAQIFEGTDVTWTVDERGTAALPRQVRVSAYRIAREALVNVRKHARAGRVGVVVDAAEAGVEVLVVDNGVGVGQTTASPSGRRHSGVVGMRDRAVASGGWWRSLPGPGGVGTAVAFFLPVSTPTPPGAGLLPDGSPQPVHAVEDARS